MARFGSKGSPSQSAAVMPAQAAQQKLSALPDRDL